jgi:UDP-N-acetylmuramoylalanine--D-glutamate ligase
MNAFSTTLFSGRRFAVVGLGKNGLPAALRLRAMGAEVVAWDDSAAVRASAAGLELRDPAQGSFD